jgi:DNA invertase Pin-like site-specific DNA recombinase
MVAKLDRLSRSLVDFSALMALAVDEGWNLVALDLGVDLSTPSGEFLANVMASAAQWERRIIGQRISEALQALKSQGVTLGRPVTVSDDTARWIVEQRDGGWSYDRIARSLNEQQMPTAQGGKRWYPSTVYAVERRARETTP